MTMLIGRIGFAIAAPLLLLGCLLTPGKFVSTLSINADRSFSFTYRGEVYANDMEDGIGGLGNGGDSIGEGDENGDAEPASETQASFSNTAMQADAAPARPEDKKRATEAKRRAMAEALSKEAGYRSVSYVGDGKFLIDYAISGVLTHSFLYPFNVDAEIALPFLVVEVRANDSVRVRAPGFANDSDSKSMPGKPDMASKLDGVFTLDTNAEIVSQNNEDGATVVGGRKTIRWRATPLTKDAPSAVLKLAPRAVTP